MHHIETINEPVWHQVESTVRDIFDIEKAYIEQQAKRSVDAKVRRLKKQLMDIETRQGRIIEALEKGALAIEDVSTRMETLKQEYARVQAELEAAIKPIDMNFDFLKTFAQKISMEQVLTFDEKREIILLVCQKIEFGKGSIYLKFRPPILKNASSEVRIQI